jgi:hypothetical protein
MLAFDRARLDSLRVGIGAALDDLCRIRCDHAEALDAMTTIRAARRTLGDVCLPRVQDILRSDVMTSYRPSASGVKDIDLFARAHDFGWQVAMDPQVVIGPAVPGNRTFDEVLTDVRSGALVPMAAPLDAEGRSGALYTSLTFASDNTRIVGVEDTTSDLLKVLDFFSDGLPVGWREEHSLTIYYLANARVTSNVHVLTAYDRDEGPETLWDRTRQATVSGYMIIETGSTRGEVNVGIGPDAQDDTQSFPLLSQTSSSYSGMFYPDESPEFRPMTHEARFESPDLWAFTTSSAPMVDGWGTWEL